MHLDELREDEARAVGAVVAPTRAPELMRLKGRDEYVNSYSFILADLERDAAEVELRHRQRGHMEEWVK